MSTEAFHPMPISGLEGIGFPYQRGGRMGGTRRGPIGANAYVFPEVVTLQAP